MFKLRHILAIAVFVVLVAVPSMLYATQGGSNTLETRIAAFKHENGDVEFALQTKDGGDWGERILPSGRTLRASAPTGKWITSTSVQLELPEDDAHRSALGPIGDVRFDVAIVVENDGSLVAEVSVDGVPATWPILDLNESWNPTARRFQSEALNLDIGNSYQRQGETEVYRFADDDEFNEGTLRWERNDYYGVSIRVVMERGKVLSIYPILHHVGTFSRPSAIFQPSTFRVLVEQVRGDRRYELPAFALSANGYQRVRQVPCTADDLTGLPESHKAGVVAYLISDLSCHVRTDTVRRYSDGELYGMPGAFGMECKYSVNVTSVGGQFARVSRTMDQGCEVLFVEGSAGTYYLVDDLGP